MNARAQTEQQERVRRGASLELMYDDWYFGMETKAPKLMGELWLKPCRCGQADCPRNDWRNWLRPVPEWLLPRHG